jgi:hypothetical protein
MEKSFLFYILSSSCNNFKCKIYCKEPSFIEIKNHLKSPLTVIPILTLAGASKTVKLKPVKIAPLSTERLSLKSHIKPKFQTGKKGGRWGDGSRPHSLFGNAQLTPISPHHSSARAFNARIFIKDLDEGLLLAVPFVIPADVINRVLEGLWWLPYPDSQAYYALQNTSKRAIHIQMELFSDGQLLKRKTFKLSASALHLIDIRKELVHSHKPSELGGIRFTYKRDRQKRTSGLKKIHLNQDILYLAKFWQRDAHSRKTRVLFCFDDL